LNEKKTNENYIQDVRISVHQATFENVMAAMMLTLRLKSLLRKLPSSLRNTSKPTAKIKNKETRRRKMMRKKKEKEKKVKEKRKKQKKEKENEEGRRRKMTERRRSLKCYYDILHTFSLNQNIFELSDII
jgi:uncharacterized membrane protein YhiD involved in acid resistance